jgi:endonuclease IV
MDLQTQMKLFSKSLERLSNELELMKQYGINEDLLVAYMCHNLHISEKKAQQIIKCYNDFYENFIKKGVTDAL